MNNSIAEFVGVRYGFRGEPGLDCYQLVLEVSDKVFGNKLPDYSFTGTWRDADAGFNAHKGDFVKVDSPEEGDIILLTIGGRPLHCGIVLNHNQMLHSLRGSNSCIESFRSIKWRHRIEGFYRWINN